MKIWHKPYKFFVILLFLAFLTGGLFIYCTEDTPDRCALCADYIPYEAPVLLNLSTGEMVELQVFEPSDPKRTGFSRLICQAGVSGYCDGGICCRVTIPEQKQPIKKEFYCRNCFTRLIETAEEGYVLLDFSAPGGFNVLPVARNSEYTMGDYAVSIFSENGQTALSVEPCGS